MRAALRLAACLWLLAASPSRSPAADAIRLVNDPTLSPDGHTLVFAWHGNLWSVATKGGLAKQLTLHPGVDRQPKFSPDGTSLAFVSDRGAGEQLYVMPPQGGFPRQLSHHSEGYSLDGWSPDGRTLLARGYRDHFWRAAERFLRVTVDERRSDELLFDDYGSEGALSPDGTQLLFVREGMRWWRKGYRGAAAGQIWLFDLRDRSFRQLVHDETESRWPLWKPDGSGFYYVSGRSGINNLWEYDLATDKSRQRTRFDDDGVVFPCLSADGSTLVFRRLFDLYRWYPADDAAPRRIDIRYTGDLLTETTHVTTLSKASEAAFSRDGLEVAFIAGGDLWVMDTELRDPRQITQTSEEERHPTFSPDGNTIWYVSDAEGEPDIWRARRADANRFWFENDTFALDRVTRDADRESDLKFSPDGSRLAFVKRRGELWTMRSDGTDAKMVLGGWDAPQYQWSPDGKQMVYAVSDNDFNRDVWIIPSDGSQPPYNVSRHPDNEADPAWSPDGKMLAFTSKRAGEMDICFVWMQAQDEERTARDRALERAHEKLDKARRPDARKPTGAEAKPQAPAIVAPQPKGEVTGSPSSPPGYDFITGRMHARVHRIAIPHAQESGLIWSPDSKRLAFQATINGIRGIYTIEVPDHATPKLLVAETGLQAHWLSEGNQIVMLRQGTPASVSAVGKVTDYRFNLTQHVDQVAKLRVAFDVCWRNIRDEYYDARLGNRNWNAIRRKYHDMAGAYGDIDTFATAVQMMFGELNGSHLGFWPNEVSRPEQDDPLDVTAHLGVRFDPSWQGPGLKIHDVIPRGPADRRASQLEPGELILSIDQRAVDPRLDLTLVLNGPIARDIRLKVQSPAGTTRDVTIRPITYDEVSELLYDKWLDDNQRHVDKLSQGKIGYLHIRGMDESSFLRFEEDLYDAGSGRQGLIIDVRDNPGGSTTDHLLTALTQPVHAVTVPRGGGAGYPQDRKVYATWNKPIVVLCNQNSFSNAEIFSHAIKLLERGKLVGVPTAGGVISTGTREVMDLGTMRMPFRGWFRANTGEDMELNGAVPDHIVWPRPGQIPQGQDIQLEKGVEVLAADVIRWLERAQPPLIKASERAAKQPKPALKP